MRLRLSAVALWVAMAVAAPAAAYTVDCNHEYTDCETELSKLANEEDDVPSLAGPTLPPEVPEAESITSTTLSTTSTPVTDDTTTTTTKTTTSLPEILSTTEEVIETTEAVKPKPRYLNINVDDLETFANAVHNQSDSKKKITDLSDVNLDEEDDEPPKLINHDHLNHDKTIPDKFYTNLQAPFNPLMNIDKSEESDTCKENDISYKIGDRIERGCEETCECTPGGVFDCTPRCKHPYIRRGRRLNDPLCFESPVDECCSIVACATGNQDTKVSKVEVCRYGNDTYQVGSKWNIGCEQKCSCEPNSVVTCKPRCNPLPQSDKCINVQDPNDECCEVQVCDVSQDVHEEPENITSSTTSTTTTERYKGFDDYSDFEHIRSTLRPLVLTEPIGSVKVLQNNTVQVNLMHLNITEDPIHLLLSSDGGKNFQDVELKYSNLILNLPGGKDYILKTKETDTKFNFTITASDTEAFAVNITEQVGCHQDGQFYPVGEEFHIGCTHLCECMGAEQKECVELMCPSHVGLELVSKGCVRWAPSPPPTPPNCCPRAARCLSDGTCHFKGIAIPNWSEVPITLTGCEQRCFCENGELDCQDVCTPLPPVPPQTLRCPPGHRPAALNISDEDCCKEWGCLANNAPKNEDMSIHYSTSNDNNSPIIQYEYVTPIAAALPTTHATTTPTLNTDIDFYRHLHPVKSYTKLIKTVVPLAHDHIDEEYKIDRPQGDNITLFTLDDIEPQLKTIQPDHSLTSKNYQWNLPERPMAMKPVPELVDPMRKIIHSLPSYTNSRIIGNYNNNEHRSINNPITNNQANNEDARIMLNHKEFQPNTNPTYTQNNKNDDSRIMLNYKEFRPTADTTNTVNNKNDNSRIMLNYKDFRPTADTTNTVNNKNDDSRIMFNYREFRPTADTTNTQNNKDKDARIMLNYKEFHPTANPTNTLNNKNDDARILLKHKEFHPTANPTNTQNNKNDDSRIMLNYKEFRPTAYSTNTQNNENEDARIMLNYKEFRPTPNPTKTELKNEGTPEVIKPMTRKQFRETLSKVPLSRVNNLNFFLPAYDPRKPSIIPKEIDSEMPGIPHNIEPMFAPVPFNISLISRTDAMPMHDLKNIAHNSRKHMTILKNRDMNTIRLMHNRNDVIVHEQEPKKHVLIKAPTPYETVLLRPVKNHAENKEPNRMKDGYNSALDLEHLVSQMEVESEVNRNLGRSADKQEDAGANATPSPPQPHEPHNPSFLPTIPPEIHFPHEDLPDYDQNNLHRPVNSLEPNLPPGLTVPPNYGEENKKLTVISLQADSQTSVKMLFGLPPVLVGLRGSVDLRYTDKFDEDISQWYSQVFAPADEVLTTPRLEFRLTGLKPSTTYKIRGKLFLHNLPVEPESEVYSVRTLDPPTIIPPEEKRREIDSRLTTVDVNDTAAHVSWRHFTEEELRFIDGIQVRYRPVGTPIYSMTELLHHSRSLAELHDLRPGTRYEASLVLVPPPRTVTELQDPGRIEFTTHPYVDPYNWTATIEARVVGSDAAELTWRGVPSPAERWVRVYRAAHACGATRREHDAFRLAARDLPPTIMLSGLQANTRCRVWLELFLTNGKVKTSNVIEINTKPQDSPEDIDNEIEASSIAGAADSRGGGRGDYYGALVVVGVVAALGAMTSLLLLLVLVRRHRPRSVPITPVPSAPRESSLPPYDNPAYKLELQQETMDL